MQSPDEGDDDRGKAVPRRYRRQQLSDRSRDFTHAGDACRRPAEQQAEPYHPVGVEAGIARGGVGKAGHAHLEAEKAAIEEDVARADRGERDQEADIEPRSRDQHRIQRGFGELLALREIESFRIAPRLVHQPAQQEVGDVNQHQAHQDFVGVEAGAQQRRDRRPQHAADGAGDDHRGQNQAAFAAVKIQCDTACKDGAEDELTFGTDVPDVRPIAACQADPDQHQRRSLEQQLGKPVEIVDRVDEERVERLHRVLAQRREQDEPGDHGQHRRKQRRQIAHDARRFRARFEFEPHGLILLLSAMDSAGAAWRLGPAGRCALRVFRRLVREPRSPLRVMVRSVPGHRRPATSRSSTPRSPRHWSP